MAQVQRHPFPNGSNNTRIVSPPPRTKDANESRHEGLAISREKNVIYTRGGDSGISRLITGEKRRYTGCDTEDITIEGMNYGSAKQLPLSRNAYYMSVCRAERMTDQYESDDDIPEDALGFRAGANTACRSSTHAPRHMHVPPRHMHVPTCATCAGENRWNRWMKKRKTQKKLERNNASRLQRAETSNHRSPKKAKRTASKTRQIAPKKPRCSWTCHAYKVEQRNANAVQSKGQKSPPKFHLKFTHRKRHLHESSSSSSSSSYSCNSCKDEMMH